MPEEDEERFQRKRPTITIAERTAKTGRTISQGDIPELAFSPEACSKTGVSLNDIGAEAAKRFEWECGTESAKEFEFENFRENENEAEGVKDGEGR
jgi:hypothetical protein